MGVGGMSVEPREAESMAVTLTRMEGKLDNVMEKVGDLRTEVTQHRLEISQLQSTTQQIESNMKSAETARIAAAVAVKADNEARVAAAKAQVDNSTQQWTPVQRLLAVFAGLAAIATVVFYLWTVAQ
jgi:septal ring factor EnvC (AmiA/AmiB activator)